MGNTANRHYSVWRLALLVGLCGGISGMLVDIDHILSAATGGQVPWNFLHQPITIVILIGCVIASGLGLYFTLVLRR